ncbi:hypothetical protein J2S00_001211 [Caldalkalibacillus uzonensis]|uniref:Uncharacterized protein n=1 Tax=Caldalkalibacillus uzonensis TaxID=353224 RepID=A0ABU0CQJ5_9BACI|nr:hypothetical protein [Caldalkalibacillus uzonensis]
MWYDDFSNLEKDGSGVKVKGSSFQLRGSSPYIGGIILKHHGQHTVHH